MLLLPKISITLVVAKWWFSNLIISSTFIALHSKKFSFRSFICLPVYININSWILSYLGVVIVTIIIYFGVQLSPIRLTGPPSSWCSVLWTSFCHSLNTFLLCHSTVLQDHLILFMCQPGNQLFLQGQQVPFSEEWYLETRIWALVCSLLLTCHCLQNLSVGTAKKYMYVGVWMHFYTNTPLCQCQRLPVYILKTITSFNYSHPSLMPPDSF